MRLPARVLAGAHPPDSNERTLHQQPRICLAGCRTNLRAAPVSLDHRYYKRPENSRSDAQNYTLAFQGEQHCTPSKKVVAGNTTWGSSYKGQPRGVQVGQGGGEPLPQEGGAAPSEENVMEGSWAHESVCRGTHQSKPPSQALLWEKWHNSPACLKPGANLRYLI